MGIANHYREEEPTGINEFFEKEKNMEIVTELYDCPKCGEKDSIPLVIKKTRQTTQMTVKKCKSCKEITGLMQLAKSVKPKETQDE